MWQAEGAQEMPTTTEQVNNNMEGLAQAILDLRSDKPEDGDFCPRCGGDLLRGKDLIQEPRFKGLWVCENMDCNYTRPVAKE